MMQLSGVFLNSNGETMTKTILTTGGAGYIGSHVAYELLTAGYQLVVFDNFSNSSPESIRRVARMTNGAPIVVEGDVRDSEALNRLFTDHKIDAVIHMAGAKAVGESVANPQKYYDINVSGSVALFGAMQRHGVTNTVFSSSATVYGMPETMPIPETAPTNPLNPYGTTKFMVEQILTDMTAATDGWRTLLLRYFNPVGAHPSGEIGEDPNGIPDNLFPYIAQVATGQREKLSVFGADYDTPDGTAVRDYIHVVDLARGHVKAIDYLLSGRAKANAAQIINLGTSTGSSVLDVHKEWETACGFPIPYEMSNRRAGDAPQSYADSSVAKKILGWEAEYDLAQMCADHWNWQSKNPQGYGE